MRLLVTTLILSLAVCPAFSMAQSAVNLDVILPLTGATAFLGTSQQTAVRAYETAINKTGGIHGAPLHFVFHDDQGSPAIAVQLINDLLPNHPVAILGPSVTATCAAVAPLFVNGPVNFCFSPSILPPHGGYVFASSITLQHFQLAMFNRAKGLGFKRIALIAATDASGQLALQYVKEWQGTLTGKDVQVVDVEAFAPNDLSVAAQV